MTNFLNNLAAWLDEHFLPIADKISSQKHLAAIKDGFIATMPISMVGAISVMLNNVLLDKTSLFGEMLNSMAFYSDYIQPIIDTTLLPLFNQIWWGTLAMAVIFSIFTIAYNFAKNANEDGLSAGVIAVSCYLVLLPQQIEGGPWGTISWTSFSSEAVFTGLIVSLVSAEIFCFVKKKGWVFKMPEQVPPAVSKAFSAMIPAGFALVVSGIVSVFFAQVLNTNLQVWINMMLQKPLISLGQSPITLIFLVFVKQFLWFFGLHGDTIIAPVLDTMYGPALQANSEAILILGQAAPYAITRNIIDIYGMHGGSGVTLALIVAIFIFSKKPQYRDLSKMSLMPGIFQINEPMIYGLPIVLNPILAIPFIIVPPVCTFIGWFFTAVIPIAGYIYISPPWVTPPVLSAFLATGGDIGATLVSLLTFVVAVLIYAPFVILANKQKD
ncbi:MAG: PTS transporter subunit EIIC [Erysipelotrichaceae bacterium]|nr:PTS transporter subunit EIIC [Erysipelotrichaceae bacterium]MDY5252589.1 PTS transporter subunit EIIC [Erysipelotrichaceae bacterium]